MGVSKEIDPRLQNAAEMCAAVLRFASFGWELRILHRRIVITLRER